MNRLRRAAETRAGHEQVAHHPRDSGPPLVVPLDPEQAYVEVQVGLQVRGVHAGEPPQVALDPGAQVVHELHRLQVRRILRIRLTPRRCTWRPSRGFCGPSPCRGR